MTIGLGQIVPFKLVAGVGLMGLWACSSTPAEDRFSLALDALRHQQFEEALSQTEAALDSLPDRSDDSRFWKLRLLKAEVLLGLKERSNSPQDADWDAEIASLLADPAPFGRLQARRVMLQAILAKGNGKDEQATSLFRQSYQQAKHLSDWNLLTEIEYHWAKLADDPEGVLDILLPVASRPLEQIEEFHLARSMINISWKCIELERWGPARDWAQRALDYSARIGNEEFQMIGQANLGTAQNRLGYLDSAASNLVQAQRLAIKLQNNGWIGNTYLGLGNNQYFRSEYKQAIEHYQKGEQYLQNVEDKEYLILNQFVALAQLGDCDRAGRTRARLQKLREDVGKNSTYQQDESDAWRDILNRGWLMHVCGDYRAAESAYQSIVDQAKGFPFFKLRALTGLGMLKMEQKQPAAANRHFQSAIDLIRQTDRAFSAQEADRPAIFSTLMDVYREYVYALIQQGKGDAALEAAESSRASLLRQRLQEASADATVDVSVEQYRQMASRVEAVFLSYWISDRGSHVWVLKGIQPAQRVDLSVDREELMEQVKRYKREILEGSDPDDMLHADGFKLYKDLLAPVQRWIPDQSNVILILDDELHELNLEALPRGTPEDWHYWIRDVTVSIAPSLHQLAASNRKSRPLTSRFVLVGDPVYSEEELQLPHAQDEVDDIQAHLISWLEVDTLRGIEAVPSAVLEALSGAGGIHINAHAFAVQDYPFQSNILLSSQGARDKLYAYEILQQGLLELDLVVLSACQTAGDDFTGEGPVGLSWAFMAVGACNVVASLWEVPDDKTALLMDSFYKNLAKGSSYAEALRQAKLHLMDEKKYSNPIAWAGFQHYLGCRPQ